ncbi:MAG: hypothetical protein U5K73_03500 [Halofilum sp. (in: g-proteobacteria)]|nr:hypothetical protein [Halofilum sp. (in: g-proteobacteria)]
MEKEIERGRVKANEDHWELTGHAWARAKEWNKAIAAYAKAAEYGDAGKYHMRRAQHVHVSKRLAGRRSRPRAKPSRTTIWTRPGGRIS